MAKQPKTNNADATTGNGADKPKKLPRSYFVEGDGTVSRNPSDQTEVVMAPYKDHDDIQRSLTNFPDAMVTLLAWHGLKQVMGDARASEGKVGEEATHEALLARLERMEAGEWVKEGERAGPRTSILAEAVIRVLRAKGEEVDEDREAAIREKLKDATVREQTQAHPAYAAEYEKIRLERQQAKAEAAAKAAAGAEGEAEAGPDF